MGFLSYMCSVAGSMAKYGQTPQPQFSKWRHELHMFCCIFYERGFWCSWPSLGPQGSQSGFWEPKWSPRGQNGRQNLVQWHQNDANCSFKKRAHYPLCSNMPPRGVLDASIKGAHYPLHKTRDAKYRTLSLSIATVALIAFSLNLTMLLEGQGGKPKVFPPYSSEAL